MDIMLNDGTYAMHVSVMEYQQLKEQGLVGNNNTTQTTSTSNVPNVPGNTPLDKLEDRIKYMDNALKNPLFESVE